MKDDRLYILIHDYAGIDFKRVWDTIQNHLPALKSNLERNTIG